MVGQFCNSSYLRDESRRISSMRPSQAKLSRLYLKNKIPNKRSESMAQVVKHLPNTNKALSIPSTSKNKKK
jgi:hypothetical protein